jgi:hypothetical protein
VGISSELEIDSAKQQEKKFNHEGHKVKKIGEKGAWHSFSG